MTISTFAQTNYEHKTLTIFKNGLVFLEKTAEVEVKNQQAVLYPLPFISENSTPIVMGSLRLKPEDNIINVLNYTRQNVGENNAHYYDNLHMLFKNNMGAKVSLTTKEETVEGYLKNIISEENTHLSKLMIVSGKQLHFIAIHSVTSVKFIDQTDAAIDKEKEGEWVYALQFAKNKKQQKIDIYYVQRGMSWFPNYYLDFETNNSATLKLEATLINDIEDFENAAINLAVGFPSFRFEKINSPLTANHALEHLINGIHGMEVGASRREQFSPLSQNMAYMDVQDYDPKFIPENANQEDLYFFKKQSISSKKGSRLAVPIFETKVTYKDLYKVELQNNLDGNGRWKQEKNHKNVVSHHIEFKNETGFPFTTGSLFFRKNDQQKLQFLAQDQLDYVAAGGKASPKMTLSADVLVTEKDKETRRDVVKDEYNRDQYLIRVESTIEITNYKPESIEIEIDKLVAGTLIKSAVKWEYDTEIVQDINPQNKVRWKLNVPSGKTTTVVYSYQYLTR